jgi:multiple sugar transport system permease protein
LNSTEPGPPSRRSHPLWHLPLLLAGGTMLLPLAFMLKTALSPAAEAMQAADSLPDMLWPRTWQWGNFAEVWATIPFLRYYLNSLGVALVATAGQVLTSACAAYAFARLEWRGRDQLFLGYLATMMIPHSVTMIPNFIALRYLPELLADAWPAVDWAGLRYLGPGADAPAIGRLVGLDSYFALTVPAMFSAYGTFMLRQFFQGIPRSLDEAARIDGASHGTIFWRIILPLARPGLTTLTILTFMSVWGSFLWPLVVTNQDYLRTLPVGLQAFHGQYGTEWHLMMAAALLMLLPVLVVFLAGQRFFVAGATVGAVKG